MKVTFVTILVFMVGLVTMFNISASNNNEAINMASPDLTGKEYLGDGIYRLHNDVSGVRLDYNVFDGVYTLNGTASKQDLYRLSFINEPSTYTLSFHYVNGSFNTVGIGLVVSMAPPDVIDTYVYVYGSSNFGEAKTYTHTDMFSLFLVYWGDGITYNNYQFKIQLQQDIVVTDYQLPIGVLQQHIQFEYDKGYNEGFYLGYDEGFNAGLDEAFNANNLMPIADKRGKGTLGPANEYFGFTIPLNKKVKSVTLLNATGYPLKPLTWVSGGAVYQGLHIIYANSAIYIPFKNNYTDFENIMEFQLNENEIIESINIIFALDNPSMPSGQFDSMLDSIQNNLGFYINNKVLNDDAIDRFKEIIEFDLKGQLQDQLDLEYKQKLDTLLEYHLKNEYQKGYNEGVASTSDYSITGLLFQVFAGMAGVLAIELLPNISIGSIVAIPLVFGIIYFILGKRKGD